MNEEDSAIYTFVIIVSKEPEQESQSQKHSNQSHHQSSERTYSGLSSHSQIVIFHLLINREFMRNMIKYRWSLIFFIIQNQA